MPGQVNVARRRKPPLTLVAPGDLDDPALVSGGNVYDRRLARELGMTVRAMGGTWPRPDTDARAALDRVLRGGPALVDGLVACGVPDVVVPHGERVAVLVHLPLGVEDPALDAGEGAVLRAARTVITTSAWAARTVVARHGLDPATVHVATPGVDPAPLAPGTDGAHRLLCLGALTPTKGQDLLVEALGTLPDHPWRLDLVGPTARDPAFVASLQRRIIDDRVTITGPRSGHDLAATMNAADLLVVPSRVETYGMAAAEALARGIPVLATDVGGLSETLDGAGILITAEDVGALGASLYRWWTEPALRAGLRLSASARACSLPTWTETSRRVARALSGLG